VASLSSSDIQKCRQVVDLYCDAWKTGKCDTLFTLVSKENNAKKVMNKNISRKIAGLTGKPETLPHLQ
jgi:hypothetical protein